MAADKTHLIFGYGSWISKKGRSPSGVDQKVWPARVSGFRRFWNAYCDLGFCVLGVTTAPEASCNGVVVAVSNDELPEFDKRETLYRKVVLDSASVEYLGEHAPSDTEIWIYVPHRIVIPTASVPLLQSYVDVALSGCLEISESFAAEFITSTVGWDKPWINDRGHEQYQRWLQSSDERAKVDSLLKQHCAEGFSQRYP